MDNGLIIVGAGQAAAQAIHTLRQNGFPGSITLVGEESEIPYQRPPLSKKYLAGGMSEDRLFLRPRDYYESNEIEVMLDESVSEISIGKSQLKLAKSGIRHFDQLLLTTGSSAKTIPLPGSELKGVGSIRSKGDVDRIQPMMIAGSRLVIIGAGYIGLEVAAIAKSMDIEVTVVESQERVLKRVVSPAMSDFFKSIHEMNGVEIRVSTQTVEIRGDEKVREVLLSEGDPVKCDVVLLAVGSKPNDELAANCGLDTDDGILVDTSCRTSNTKIFAAGDCTRFNSTLYGRSIRLESVQNAIDHGEAAANSICDEQVNYDPVPWFWSDQYDIKLQMAGLSQGYEEAITVGDPKNRKFYIAYLRDKKLIAVDSVCHPKSYMLGRRSIGQTWHKDLLPQID